MAFSNDYLLNVDVKNTYSISTPTFRQGDNGTLRFKVFDGNKLFDLTGFTNAKVVCKLPSEETYVGSATLNNKKEIVYNLSPEIETSEEGYVEVILSVYSGDSVVSVQPFNIYMYDNLNRNANDVGVIKGLIQEVQVLKGQVESALTEVNQSISEVNDLKTEVKDIAANEAQRKLNESQRVANEVIRESNEKTRLSNETKRESNEQKRISSETVREEHEVVRQEQFEQNQATIDRLIPLVENVENKESWSISTQYKKNNIVEFNGSSYMALRDNIGQQPPILPIKSNLDWSILAEKGINGTGAVSTVNGMNPDITGNITINSSSVGAIPLTEKGVANGVAKLSASGKVVDALGNEVEGKVTSVNTKIGDVVLSASDVGTYSTAQIDNKIDILSENIGDLTKLKTKNKDNIVNAINELQEYKEGKPPVYGVKIDALNSNPETAVTYTDNALGFTSAKGNNGNFSYGSWQDKFPFNQIKPCVLKNGVVNYYLNPNDYTKKLDGGNADITSGNDGDVMVEFPKIYWKFETIGNDLYIRYSDKQVDSTYKCLAHNRGSSEKDNIYLSAYMGFSLSSKLRSLSGKTPTVNQTISQFRTLAKANGAGYEQSTYYQILMLQVLFIVMFKNRDSQTALGRGYVDGNSSSIATGGTNTKGMFYGETTGKLQNKFCGIEDFWGNVYYWIDGMFCDASRNILIGNDNYNNTGSGYTNYGQGAVSNLGGYIDKVQGGTETGFIIKSGSGSATTYYADYGDLDASCLPRFGGIWSAASVAGAFPLQVSYSASASFVNLSARLSLC